MEDFAAMEIAVYGNRNLEEDPELIAELLALEQEERQSRAAPAAARGPVTKKPAPALPSFGIDADVMAAALADNVEGEVEVEDDEALLNELSDLVGEEPSSSGSSAPPPPPVRQAPLPPRAAAVAPAPKQDASHSLRELLAVYKKMKAASEKENNSAKTRRLQRSTDKLKELIVKADKGLKINPDDIPPAPPGWQPSQSAPAASNPVPVAVATPITMPAVPHPAHHPTANPVRAAAASPPTSPPPVAPVAPPVPPRKESAAGSAGSAPTSKKDEVMAILMNRRKAFVENGKAAVAAQDKDAAIGYVQMSKMFDQAISALESASVDDLDLSEIPKTPPPYRKKEQPKTFIEGLQSRQQRYADMAEAAKKAGNDRKVRMNQRMIQQYAEAIALAKAGKPVNVEELPSLPDMLPLPPQKTGPAPGMKPPPQVGPLAPSGPPQQSRNATQLEFLLQRQEQFKEAAIAAKASGNMELAKKYLLDSKGFDKMILAARSGLPVSIKETPIPPQVTTATPTLQPKIVPTTTSSTGVEGRGEALAMLEKGLIEQVQLAENNRMRFTRLGDVGKVKLFEGWAKTSKQDLLLIRAVAKQGLNLPKFHIETRQIPSADLFPDLAEDALELTIIQCRDVPMPSGYETQHANIFLRWNFPYPTETPQSGKSKLVSSTTSPQFDETVIFQIGTRKNRGNKLGRVLKRSPLKLEVYQKGGFLRSDKLLGSCEWKLDGLESTAELEESLPLKDGRKAVGGLVSLRVRVREPLGDAKMQVTQQKWIVLDN